MFVPRIEAVTFPTTITCTTCYATVAGDTDTEMSKIYQDFMPFCNLSLIGNPYRDPKLETGTIYAFF